MFGQHAKTSRVSGQLRLLTLGLAASVAACGGDGTTGPSGLTNRATFASAEVPGSIVPDSYRRSAVQVSGMSGTVSELTLRVRISGWTNDVTLSLAGPDGSAVYFYDWGALVGTAAPTPAELVFTTRSNISPPRGTIAGELTRHLGRAPNGSWYLSATNEIKGFRCPTAGRGCVLSVEQVSLELVTQ